MGLGVIYVITPLMGWTWPSLIPIALTAAATYGYKKLTDINEDAWLRGRVTREMEALRRVTVPVDELVADLVGEEVGRDDRLIFGREDIRLIFRRDPRGKFFVDVLGPREQPAALLRREAMQFARELVQEFAYNRLVREMEARGLNIVEESVDAETGDIVLTGRKWT
jgi:hypothetical protein